MFTLQALQRAFVSTRGATPSPLDLDALRERCAMLMADLPIRERKELLHRLKQLRRTDDLLHLRAALFDTIARFHGETTARARLATLGEQFK